MTRSVPLSRFTPSPAAWENQVLYFLLLDRFSDGREKDGYRDSADRPAQTGTTPLYQPGDSGRVDYGTWLSAGNGWQGGTLAGLKSKLGYLRRLGITALWVSPIFRVGSAWNFFIVCAGSFARFSLTSSENSSHNF